MYGPMERMEKVLMGMNNLFTMINQVGTGIKTIATAETSGRSRVFGALGFGYNRRSEPSFPITRWT